LELLCEVEAIANVVGRNVGLDTSNSTFYLAAWRDEESEVIQDRLERISAVAEEIFTVVDQ
jgi:hypothetical protein